jgi:hypothetical protein
MKKGIDDGKSNYMQHLQICTFRINSLKDVSNERNLLACSEAL